MSGVRLNGPLVLSTERLRTLRGAVDLKVSVEIFANCQLKKKASVLFTNLLEFILKLVHRQLCLIGFCQTHVKNSGITAQSNMK